MNSNSKDVETTANIEPTSCDCIKEVEAKSLNRIKDKNPGWDVDKTNRWDDTGLMPVTHLFGYGDSVAFEFKYRYTFKKVNGQTSNPRTGKISIIPTFCPFCGRKLHY